MDSKKKPVNRVCIVIPYFGKYPDTFPYWLASVKGNPSIDFLIFMDNDSEYNYPPNVIVEYMEFNKMRSKIQKLYDFEIALSTPYKFCDFKPAFGEIFFKYLQGYDFWGYGDLDVVYGNIRKYLSNEILDANDKIFTRGHFCLIRNDEIKNKLYRKNGLYKNYFSQRENMSFDEKREDGFNGLFFSNAYPVYEEDSMIADISIKHREFRINSDESWKPNVFCFQVIDGTSQLTKFYIEDDNVKEREYLYIHLQKRRMVRAYKGDNGFMIIPNRFTSIPSAISTSYIRKNSRRTIVYIPYLQYRFNNSIKKLKRCGNSICRN